MSYPSMQVNDFDSAVCLPSFTQNSSISLSPEGILCAHGCWKARLYQVPTISSTLSCSYQHYHISRPGAEDQDGTASTIGIMQALISVFLDDNDKLRSINAGRTRITFLLRPPLYYVCVSSWGEPESVVCVPSILS